MWVRSTFLGVVSALLATSGLSAQGKGPKPHVRISEPQARATALARVPHASVSSEELEHEGGRWIYSYDLKVPGRSGIDEVNVDAMTGRIVAVQHEGPRNEAKEVAAEAKEKAAAANQKAANATDRAAEAKEKAANATDRAAKEKDKAAAAEEKAATATDRAAVAKEKAAAATDRAAKEKDKAAAAKEKAAKAADRAAKEKEAAEARRH